MDEQSATAPDPELVQALAACLDELEVAAARFPDEPRFVVPIAGSNGQYMCFVQAEDDGVITCTSHCPLVVPATRRAEVARLVERVNNGLRLGAFELDADHGTLRFETAVDLAGVPLTASMLAPLLFGNAMMLDDWLPAIVDVIHLLMDPDLAWAAAQARLDAEDG
jgi:hypothetical protein